MASNKEKLIRIRTAAHARLQRTEMDDRLLYLKKKGLTNDEIAAELGVSRSLIPKRLGELGYGVRSKAWQSKGRTKQVIRLSHLIQKCQDLWWDGVPVPEIAKRLDVSVSTVYDWARRGAK